MPKVSVLMPVFNGAIYLGEAIESILRQSFRDFELIVVDDGSTDETAEILARYASADRRVVIVSQVNGGIVKALNQGLSVVRGEYVARMDADDLAHPERLSMQVDFLDRHPDTVVCGSDYEVFGNRRGTVRVPRSDAHCKAQLLVLSCFAHPTVMIRMRALSDHGIRYREAFQFAEDYKLWSELAPIGRFANLPAPLMRYRVHAAQVSSSKTRSQRQVHTKIAATNLRAAGIMLSEEDIERFLWPARLTYTSSFVYAGDSLRFMRECLRGVNHGKSFMAGKLMGLTIRNAVKLTVPESFVRT